MDDSSALSPQPAGPLRPSTWKLRRRNSISTSVVVPAKLSLLSPATPPIHSSSFPAQNGAVQTPTAPLRPPRLDLELLSLKGSESYTSLKDLLPTCSAAATSPAVNSPTAVSAYSGYEISIRNRLVKQAAWAYLQPMSAASGPSGPNFLRRLCLKLSPCLSFTRQLFPFVRQSLRRALLCLGIYTER